MRQCHIEEVRLNPDENYYYFINSINDLYNVISEYQKLVLPETVEKTFVECKNFNLVYLNEHEFEVEDCLILLEEIIQKFNKKSILEIVLLSLQTSYNFYEKLGFVKSNIKFIEKNENIQDCIMMNKTIIN